MKKENKGLVYSTVCAFSILLVRVNNIVKSVHKVLTFACRIFFSKNAIGYPLSLPC